MDQKLSSAIQDKSFVRNDSTLTTGASATNPLEENYRRISLPVDGIIVRLLVTVGTDLRPKQALLIYDYEIVSSAGGTKRMERREMESAVSGTLSQWSCKPGDRVRQGQILATIKPPCAHPVNFGGLCGVCGKDLTISDEAGIRHDSRVNIMVSHEKTNLMVSQKEAERLEAENARRLMKDRKLSLILDLDQTVIHATIYPHIDYWLQHPRFKDHPSLKDVYRFQLPDSPGVYFVKLRPGLRDFLTRIGRLFELHIYTMGTRNYASTISKIIDPNNEIFKERVLSRDESGSFTQKTIKRLFPCDDSMVLVLDDRADVWQWSENLIKVRPYHFFIGTGDINAPPTREHRTPSENLGAEQLPPPPVEEIPFNSRQQVITIESNNNQQEAPDSSSHSSEESLAEDLLNPPFLLEDPDQELITLTNILEKLHSDFYKIHDTKRDLQPQPPPSEKSATSLKPFVHVTDILGKLKRQVFGGTTLAFSGLVPVGQDPKRSEVWRLAESFGASCSVNITRQLTHLIAAKWGTDKVRDVQRLSSSIKIVNPQWFYDSVSRWALLPEVAYEYNERKSVRQPDSSDTTPGFPSQKNSKCAASEDEDEADFYDLSTNLSYRSLNSAEISELNKELEDELGELSEDEQEYDQDYKVTAISIGSSNNEQSRSNSAANRRKYEPRARSPLSQVLTPGTEQPDSNLGTHQKKRRQDFRREGHYSSGEGSETDVESATSLRPKSKRRSLEKKSSRGVRSPASSTISLGSISDDESDFGSDDFADLARQLDDGWE